MKADNLPYERFFELSPDLLCIAGYDGFFKKINPAVSKALCYTTDELYARSINDFVYDEDKEITAKARFELTKSKPLFNFENRYVTKHGEIVWLSWSSLPVASEQLVFAIAKNITHKKRMEAERNSLLSNLTMVNKELRQLTYSTTHDLRSPVNNLLSLFNLLDTSKIRDQETVEIMEFLQLSGENLKHALNSSLDLLSEKNKGHCPVEDVSLQECLNTVLQSIRSLIQISKATLRTDFSEVDKIKFNKASLESVFLNLVTNSIKYARPECLPDISIYSERVNGINRLIVSDNGLGFDMEKVQGEIFGLNRKFHDHTDSKGIGLYLVYNHVTGLGGKIIVESKVNEGTKFTISFKA